MGLETFGHIDDLNSSNPVDATDGADTLGEHVRGIKSTLKTDFPGITGAVTATQTELNRLDGLVGGFLTDAVANATGTDTITCTFSPAITLTDKTTVMVRAAGANTTTTPTFNPNALGAKTIVKNGNQALVAGDIPNQYFVMLLQYNSTNDNWELVNAAIKAATAVSGYSSGNLFYIDSTDGLAASYILSSNLTESTWESIGPTGSGASNIWTSLDAIPSTCKALIFQADMIANDAGGGANDAYISARATGQATAFAACYKYKWHMNLPAATSMNVVSGSFFVPVDSSNRFDAYWYIEADTLQTATIYLVGWIDGN